MINLPPLHSTSRIDIKTISAVLKSWQIGQIIDTRAKTSSNSQGELQLQVGQHLLDARTKTPILAGEELKLQVINLGQVPLLKILNTPTPLDPVTIYLRQAVPNPESLQKTVNLLNSIQKIIPEISSTSDIDLKEFSQHIKQLIQIPLKTETITSKNIQQFIQQSGFNFEKNLVSQNIPTKDFKFELLQIKKTIDVFLNHLKVSTNDLINSNNITKTSVKTDSGNVLFTDKAVLTDKIFLADKAPNINNPSKTLNKIDPDNLFLADKKINTDNKTEPSTIINTKNNDVAKNISIINTLVSANRLPALANYILYSIPLSDTVATLNSLNNPMQFNNGFYSETQTLTHQALQKLTQQQIKHLKQWTQFIPVFTELRSLVEQSINTITNNQLQSVRAEADSALLLLFNLFIAKTPDWIDQFNIRIYKDETEQDDEQHWSVTIQFEMPDLGAIEAKLILVKRQLHASFTSESLVTHQLVHDNLPILETALNSAGFTVATISCKQDKIEDLNSLKNNHGPLLEDKA